MNKICHYMEDNLKEINEIKRKVTPLEVIDLMRTSVDIEEELINKMDGFCKRYFEKKKELKNNSKGSSCLINIKKDSEKDGNFSTIEQYEKFIREEALSCFGNGELIANIVVEYSYIRNKRQSKSFAWKVFGKYLVENIIRNTIKNNESSSVIVNSDNGSIEYLYKKYEEMGVDLSDNI